MPPKKEKFVASNALEEAAVAVAAKYQGKPQSFGFDPTIILTILAAIGPLLANCLKNRSPEEVARAAKNPGIFQRLRLRRACRRECETRSEAEKLEKAVLAAAKEMPEEQILDCCAATQGLVEAGDIRDDIED